MYPYARSAARSGPAMSPPMSASPRSGSQRDLLSDRSSDFENLTLSDKWSAQDGQGTKATGTHPSSTSQKDTSKLLQIVQKFFTKGALTIISSRVDLPQSFGRTSTHPRINRWFNLLLPESDLLSDDVYEWAVFDMVNSAPRDLVIEVYLDASELSRNQTLVIADERGAKWDVCKALGKSRSYTATRTRADPTQIILERWKLQLKDRGFSGEQEGPHIVYRNALLLFRALYTYLRMLPAWQFGRRIAKEPVNLTSLRPSYRIVADDVVSQTQDLLTTPVFPSPEPTVVKHVFAPTNTPIGSLGVEVTYRSKCDFHVADTDSLLSSHFRVMDDQRFRPSLHDPTADELSESVNHIGSLPTNWKSSSRRPELQHAYGSLATYHDAFGGRAASPLSALQPAGQDGLESTSGSPPTREPPDHRVSVSSKSSLRAAAIEGSQISNRRLSVSFQPFKAGSLSSSPLIGGTQGSQPPKTSDISKGLQQTRNRTSLTALPQAALRIPTSASPEVAVESPSPTSPKPPMTRYSSSFSNRKSRLSSGGSSGRNEEMTGSSMRGSQSSSNTRHSGVLGEGRGGSSASLQTDDDQIAEFIKLLDTKKELPSFNRTDAASRDASTRRTTAALSKYKGLRDSHVALSDSLSSSTMLQRSVSSPSRVPALIAGSSLSSMSPGKPISPHTPHTPAIPSRLSSAAIAEDFEESDHSDRGRRGSSGSADQAGDEAEPQIPGSRPIDVPMSPQYRARTRRSSSAAHHHRQAAVELNEYGMRSASVPIRERAEPKRVMSQLALDAQNNDNKGEAKVAAVIEAPTGGPSAVEEEATAPQEPDMSRHAALDRPRLARGGSRGGGRGSSLSFGHSSGDSGRAGRHSFSSRNAVVDDDEPLLFTMSELEAQAARRSSIEDMTAAVNAAAQRGAHGGSSSLRESGRGW